ncbi:MAG: HVA1 family protein [Cyanophyceae cyanobacterium]
MGQQYSKGDKVEWNAGDGTTGGTVKGKVTESQEVEGHRVAASPDDPRYLVENENTGNVTGHKPETLAPQGDSEQDASQDNSEAERYLQEFQEAVNMSAQELQEWLKTDESQSVGQKKDDGEAIGHESGREIVKLLNKNKSDYTEDDLEQMKRVVSYVHRHLAQKPSGNVEDTPWRYSLMNWGHDPLK